MPCEMGLCAGKLFQKKFEIALTKAYESYIIWSAVT